MRQPRDNRGTTTGRPQDDRGTTMGRLQDDRGTTTRRLQHDRGTTRKHSLFFVVPCCGSEAPLDGGEGGGETCGPRSTLSSAAQRPSRPRATSLFRDGRTDRRLRLESNNAETEGEADGGQAEGQATELAYEHDPTAHRQALMTNTPRARRRSAQVHPHAQPWRPGRRRRRRREEHEAHRRASRRTPQQRAQKKGKTGQPRHARNGRTRRRRHEQSR